MELIELRQLGNELANLMKNIDEFRKSFRSLTESIDRSFDFKEHYAMTVELFRMADIEEKTGIYKPTREYLVSEKKLRNKQRAKGWNDTEIDSHKQWIEESEDFQLTSAGTFIAGLFTKYMSLSIKHGSNQIFRTILTKIIMDALDQHLADTYKLLHEGFTKYYSNSKEAKDEANLYIRGIFSLKGKIQDYLEYFSEDRTVYINSKRKPLIFDFVPKINNRFLENDVERVMKSIAGMYEYDVEWGVDDTSEGINKNSKLGNQ